MAKRGKFEGGMAQPEGWPGSRAEVCAIYEMMALEAIDGTLTAAEQVIFDRHIAGCEACRRELAEAQRGEAWLSLLKSQVVEPPADLLARVLAGTTGGFAGTKGWKAEGEVASAAAGKAQVPAARPNDALDGLLGGRGGAALPARVEEPAGWTEPGSGWGWSDGRASAQAKASAGRQGVGRTAAGERVGWMSSWASRWASVWATMQQPRLAMTVGMAFFSIALTLNLTGVRLRDLRASDFTFSALKRTAADAHASVARIFENNREVYQVESRLNELRSVEAMNDASSADRR
ncbi:MAG: anti-sigma factor family protein [Acidobacteriaceae bacterium]